MSCCVNVAQELHSRGPQHVEMSPQMYRPQNLNPLRALNDDQHNVQQLLGSINSSLNPEQYTSCVTLEGIAAGKESDQPDHGWILLS